MKNPTQTLSKSEENERIKTNKHSFVEYILVDKKSDDLMKMIIYYMQKWFDDLRFFDL